MSLFTLQIKLISSSLKCNKWQEVWTSIITALHLSFLVRVFSTRHFPNFLFGLFRCESLLHIRNIRFIWSHLQDTTLLRELSFIILASTITITYKHSTIANPPPLSSRWTVQNLTGINGQPSSRNMLDELIGVTQHICCNCTSKSLGPNTWQ